MAAYNAARTEYLEALGFQVMRVGNSAVMRDLESVVSKISEETRRPEIEFRPHVKLSSPLVIACPATDIANGEGMLRLAAVPLHGDRTDASGFVTEKEQPAEIVTARGEALCDQVRNRVLVTDQPEQAREALASMSFPGLPVIVDLGDLLSLAAPQIRGRSLSTVADGLGLHADEANPVAQLHAIVVALLLRFEPVDDASLGRIARWCDEAGWNVGAVVGLLSDDRLHRRPLRQPGEDKPLLEARFGRYRKATEPLEAIDWTDPIREEDVRAIFTDGGTLAGCMPGYEERSGQIAMAAAVTRAFNDHAELLIEAGTGTGKGLAYLAPAAIYALTHGEPVVIATNTLALQDQLRDQDVAILRAAIKEVPGAESLRVQTVKGRANYLCLQRWQSVTRLAPTAVADARLRAKATIWLSTSDSGDRGELALEGEESNEFQQYAAVAEHCAPSSCQFYQRNQCFLYRARRQAEGAHLILTNHALLLSGTDEGGSVLPYFDRLIIDEAHHLEEQATNQLGFQLRHRELEDMVTRFARYEGTTMAGLAGDASRWLNQLARGGDPTVDKLGLVAGRINSIILRTLSFRQYWIDFVTTAANAARGDADQRGSERAMRITPAIRLQEGWQGLESRWETLDHQLAEFGNDATWLKEQLETLEPSEQLRVAIDDVIIALVSWQRSLAEYQSHLREFVVEPSANYVYWMEWPGRQFYPTLAAAPLQVGEILRERLYAGLETLVLTSATLSSGGSFQFLKSTLGLEKATSRIVESPFDHATSTMLYIADDIPEPRENGYEEAVAAALTGLGVALEGRTLALFTSYVTMQAVDQLIREPLAAAGVQLLAQRTDGSALQLIERLRSSEGVLVLGAATMWEGIDVPGAALSALAVVRLPFSVPTDPVYQARAELYENDFMELSLPQAVLRFRQGFGRLIRRQTDRGVCVVLDRRIVSKQYGRHFLESLPGYTMRRGPASQLPQQAKRWLR